MDSFPSLEYSERVSPSKEYSFSNKTSLLQQKTVITIAEKIRKTAPFGAVLDVL